MDEIDPYLIAAIGDMEKPLPANPDGVARLESVVAELGQPPAPEAIPPLPQTTQAISGRTFTFEPNFVQLQSLRLDFDDSAEAAFQLEFANEPGPRVAVVGLDGIYRPSRAGRPVFARGYWADGFTFVVDYNEGPGLAAYTLRMRFDGDRMLLEIPGLGSLEGRSEQP